MKHDSRAMLAALAVCILLGSAGPASADSPYRPYSSTLFVTSNFRLSFQRQWSTDTVAPGAPGEAGTVSPVLLPLSVSSFRSVGDPLMPRRVAAGVPDLDEPHRRALEGNLLELLRGYEQLLDQRDEQRLKNNLAGAFLFLFRSAYCVLKDGQELSGEQQESLLQQINASIAMGLKDRRLSDKEKQELYESVVLSGTIIRGLYSEGSTEQLKAARDLAKELMEQWMGLTIEKVRLDGNTVRMG
ncbi:DUF6683 family protein [Archangium sp.]|jgi:hypothetical protein|uniref:DUF6683 family protein n=1 Tax=Archangium sp. TaxID=1872627 RepID=UPI00389AF072